MTARSNFAPFDAIDTLEQERAYKVTTDTMAPAFPAGCSVIIDTMAEAKSGDFVLAVLPNGARVLRQLDEESGERYLVAFNAVPAAPPVPLGTEILGVVEQMNLPIARAGE